MGSDNAIGYRRQEVVASLRIDSVGHASADVDGTVISRLLDLDQTLFIPAGQPVSSRNPGSPLTRHGAWRHESPLGPIADVGPHLVYFCDLLEPRTERLGALLKDPCFSVDLFLGVFAAPDAGSLSVELDPAAARRVGALNLPLIVDIYAADPAEK